MKNKHLNIKLSPIAKKFIFSSQFTRVILGPVGSAKTTICIFAILRHAMEQPVVSGVRSCRVLVLRKTEPQLKATVIKSLLSLFPMVKMNYGRPITGYLTFRIPDGTLVHVEFSFVATAIQKDEDKLLSYEATIVYANEGNKILKSLISVAAERAGRYPSPLDGGVNWFGVLMDCNAFPATDWMYKDYFSLFPISPPLEGDYYEDDEMLVIRQPPGLLEFESFDSAYSYSQTLPEKLYNKHPTKPEKTLDSFYYVPNPQAENLINLPPGYYTKSLHGKTSRATKLRTMNHFIDLNEDSVLCYPMFDPYRHIEEKDIPHSQVTNYILGWDFGRDPSCCVIFVDKNNNIYVRTEISIHNASLDTAIPIVEVTLKKLGISTGETLSFIDSSGAAKAQSVEYSCKQSLIDNGFNQGNIVTQNVMSRLNAVRKLLYTDARFRIHPDCTKLIKGFLSSFHFKEEKKGTTSSLEIEKTPESHIHDALQYGCLGIASILDRQTTIPNF